MGARQGCSPRYRIVHDVGARCPLKVTGPGEFGGWKGKPGWSEPTTAVCTATDRGFSPLDEELALRTDHLSEGAARVATRKAICFSSFEKAAADYEDSVGQPISRMTLWRVATAAGQALSGQKALEAEEVSRPAERGEDPRQPQVVRENPIEEQANISSDGVMVRLRDEGWKEAKMAAISRVQVLAPKGTRPGERPGRRDFDPRVVLDQHSYIAGVWDADEFGRYQYAEGLRRGLDTVETLTSVNDGAPWIGRVTKTNWPGALLILDWPHAAGHIYDVANTMWGEGSAVGKEWAEARKEELWSGRLGDVLQELSKLRLGHRDWPEGQTDPRGYFEENFDRMHYDLFREEGYPIGSGTVESEAKNIVQLRMKRPGRGWGRDKVNGMLALLAEYHSGRFSSTWESMCKTPA